MQRTTSYVAAATTARVPAIRPTATDPLVRVMVTRKRHGFMVYEHTATGRHWRATFMDRFDAERYADERAELPWHVLG